MPRDKLLTAFEEAGRKSCVPSASPEVLKADVHESGFRPTWTCYQLRVRGVCPVRVDWTGCPVGPPELSGWTDRPTPGVTRKPAAPRRPSIAQTFSPCHSRCGRFRDGPLSTLAAGLAERIKTLAMGVEELLNRQGRVAARIDDQTIHEFALRVEVRRHESCSVGDQVNLISL